MPYIPPEEQSYVPDLYQTFTEGQYGAAYGTQQDYSTPGSGGSGGSGAPQSEYDKLRAQGLSHAQAMKRLAEQSNKPPGQTVAELGDDYDTLADKLDVDVQDLVTANPNDSTVKAGATYNVPYNVPHNASPSQKGGGPYDDKGLIENLLALSRGEITYEQVYQNTLPEPGEIGSPEWWTDNVAGKKFWDIIGDITGSDGSDPGFGKMPGGGKPLASPAYNPPPPTDPREASFGGEDAGSLYGDTSQTIPSSSTTDIWEGHNYWEGHVDPYRLALNLAKDAGMNLPPHPSENINDYMYSGDFAANYLRDIRAWEDSVYGGQRASMVDIIKYDDVLYGKLMNDQLSTGDLLEIHRELPALIDQYYDGDINNFPVEDQATYDILGKLGYLPETGGYGGYSYPSYGGGYSRGSSPQKLNSYPAYLQLTSWSI